MFSEHKEVVKKNIEPILYKSFYGFLRTIVCVVIRLFYKVTVFDRPCLKDHEPALFVPNHITYLDALLVMSLTKRKVRFVVDKRIYNIGILKPFLKILKVTPISRMDNPKEIGRSLRDIKETLKQGHVVVFFAEGQITQTGNTLGFKRGFEYVVRGSNIPVYPLYLHGIWGGVFSFVRGKTFRRCPKLFKHKIEVFFGKAMKSPVTAFELRCRLLELGSRAMEHKLKRKKTLSEELLSKAKRRPWQFSMGDSSGRKMNRSQVFIAAYILSQRLRSFIGEDKYIGIMLPSSIGGALSNIALMILNKVAVQLNYTSTDATIKQCLSFSGVKTTITSRKFVDKINKSLPGKVVFIEDIAENISVFNKVMAAFIFFVIPIRISRKMFFRSFKRDINEEAVIIFTSGSTGSPKGVMLSHKNILAECQGIYRIINCEQHSIMGVLPFFHSFGYTTTLWLPMIKGMKVIFHPNPLDSKVIGKTLARFKATLLFTTPSFLSMYTRKCSKKEFESLWLILTGAEKLKKNIADLCEEKLGVTPMEGYGCSEVSPVVSCSVPDFKKKGTYQKAHKKGKIGATIPGVAVSIRDIDSGNILGEGQNGLLYVKGPTVMKGYLKRPDKTAQVIDQGWYCTGDIANLDCDGFLEITDRISRFSKIAGEMVPHIMIEQKIQELLDVQEQACVVSAVEDQKKGEKLVVLHTIDVDPVYIVHKLQNKDIPNLWIPQADNFYRIKELPILGTGKMDLVRVKEIAYKLSGVNNSL